MAHVYPKINSSSIEYLSEKMVYEKLLELPDDYTVFYSVSWLKNNAKDFKPSVWYENDFVIMHRKYGVLVVEVKGGDWTIMEGSVSDILEHLVVVVTLYRSVTILILVVLKPLAIDP